MAQPTEVHESILGPAPTEKGESPVNNAWSKVKLAVTRSIFWSYGRGSWQYDVIVVAILAFLFLSPRSWFNDRPTLQLTELRHQQGVVEMNHAGKEVTYLVDARLVKSRDEDPDRAISTILKENLNKPFTVKSIDPVVDRHQVILGYTVVVEQ